MFLSLGKVVVATAGTPVQATVNQTSPTAPLVCHAILVEVLPTNTGKIYVGLVGFSKTTLVGALAILPPPTTNSYANWGGSVGFAPNAVEASQVYIDADNSGEGVLISLLLT